MKMFKLNKLDSKIQAEIPSLYFWISKNCPRRQSTQCIQAWVSKSKSFTLLKILQLASTSTYSAEIAW
jgi:hypothetical protein